MLNNEKSSALDLDDVVLLQLSQFRISEHLDLDLGVLADKVLEVVVLIQH